MINAVFNPREINNIRSNVINASLNNLIEDNFMTCLEILEDYI
ncbi:hypothetical protein [Halonatronum saccharophilum]|nr:hypothetical protein [Halonatronum saccharophilum]